MRDVVIKAESLGKKYVIGHQVEGRRYIALRDVLAQGVRDVWHKTRDLVQGKPIIQGNTLEELWALRDVSFEIGRGEAVGIIGRNGAGKSTLLKVLSRITEPSAGRVTIKGRVSSLLEVGTGFHPELTGRENIYLNGAILGMTRQEIKRKFDDIVGFAEVDRFLDTPVKRYSSGMYVRLAFAVAAHLEPEILLVDEVLAVGDAEFQKKCLGKMGQVTQGGRTVLFVSHNMWAVQNLCPKCIWIDRGRALQIGRTAEVVQAYIDSTQSAHLSGELDLRNWPNRYGSGEARILSARLLDEESNVTTTVRRTRPMAVEFTVESQYSQRLVFSAVVMSDSGVRVLHLTHHDHLGPAPVVVEGRCLVRLVIPNLPICAGSYSIALGIHSAAMSAVDVALDVLPFVADDVVDSPRPYKTTVESAYCWTQNEWSITPVRA